VRTWKEYWKENDPDGELYSSDVEKAWHACAAQYKARIEQLERENHRLKLNLVEPTIELRIERATAPLQARIERVRAFVEKWRSDVAAQNCGCIQCRAIIICAEDVEAALEDKCD
jgi:hypothetical protein